MELCSYVDRDTAMGKLAFVTPENKVMMQVDNWSNLGSGQLRQSVQIRSKKKFVTLFDLMARN